MPFPQSQLPVLGVVGARFCGNPGIKKKKLDLNFHQIV